MKMKDLVTAVMIIMIISLLVLVSTLNNEMNEKNNKIQILEELNNDWNELYTNQEVTNQKYLKQMINGLTEFHVAGLNNGYANAYYDEASESYTIDDFFWCNIYASNADTYYSYTSQSYRDAKAFFKQSEQYTITNNTKNLAYLFVELSEVNAEIASEMHEANEYFTSACYYYNIENYYIADNEIDKMNNHIHTRDDIIPKQNDIWSEIYALLGEF